MTVKIKVERTSEKGDLPIMLCWQSLDGRLELEYYQISGQVTEKYDHLKKLGRNPQIWLHIDEDTMINEETLSRNVH